MLLGLLLSRDADQVHSEQRWKTAFLILAACVLPEKRAEVTKEVKTQEEELWLETGIMAFVKAIGNTVTLACWVGGLYVSGFKLRRYRILAGVHVIAKQFCNVRQAVQSPS